MGREEKLKTVSERKKGGPAGSMHFPCALRGMELRLKPASLGFACFF